MTGIPPRGTDLVMWMRRNRNSRVQAWLSLASFLMTGIGCFGLLSLASDAGLFHPRPYIPYGSVFTSVDGLTGFILLLCATALMCFRVNDGDHYPSFWRRQRPGARRSALVDVAAVVFFLAATALWAEGVYRPVLRGRAGDPAYVRALPFGTDPSVLTAAVGQVMTAYYIIVGLCVLLHVVGLFFNPVTLDTYFWSVRRFGGRHASGRSSWGGDEEDLSIGFYIRRSLAAGAVVIVIAIVTAFIANTR